MSSLSNHKTAIIGHRLVPPNTEQASKALPSAVELCLLSSAVLPLHKLTLNSLPAVCLWKLQFRSSEQVPEGVKLVPGDTENAVGQN